MKTAIVLIVKNERRFIKEWVDWHLSLGFDDIYIYEDYRSDSHVDIFAGYDKVHVSTVNEIGIPDYNGTSVQGALYTKTMQMFKGMYDWVLYIDVDEFLILEQPLLELLEEFNNETGILLDWKIYTANGHIKRPECNVMDAYTETVDVLIDGPYWAKKSFVNLNKATKWHAMPHIIKDAVDVLHNPDASRVTPVFSKAWLNHYFSKSWEDYVDRMCNRGNMNNYSRTFDLFFKTNPNMLYLRDKLLDEIRWKHTKKVMWISKEKKLISGGNVSIINKIKLNIIYGK